MILSVDGSLDYAGEIVRLSASDPFACRIISLYNSYRPDLVFVDYWLIADEEENFTGAIARNGASFILFLTDKTDLEEVSSFMRVAGASGVLCNGAYQLDLFGSRSATGAVLVRNKLFETENDALNISEPDIKSAYELIVKCADENFTPPPFEDFYVDVNHRLRHGTMRMYGITAEERLVSVAMTVAESDSGAVLGAVACDPSFRKRGYGSDIVKYLTNRLVREKKCVYLHRAQNVNASFYCNLGFEAYGTWREYYFVR